MKMNKLLIMFLIIAMTIPIISYAINLPTEEQAQVFLSCDKKEATKGEKVILSINLDLINYENFEFTLTSTTNLDNISTEQDNIDITTTNNSFKFIANRSELNINQIALYYQIPEEIEVGTKIELIGVVKEYIDNEQLEETETEAQIQKVTITITVIENKEESNDENQNEKPNLSQNNQNNKEESVDGKVNIQQTNDERTTQSKTVTTQVQTKSGVSNLSVSAETNTYNGESNNYLSTLKIQDVDMNPQFAKTNTTYFIGVANNLTEIQITAKAEDENATVNIYGNDNLQLGENKILISVTAENGDVKIYRIYVTKNS